MSERESLFSFLRRLWRGHNRYEQEIPQEIRELAEAHRFPKPMRWFK